MGFFSRFFGRENVPSVPLGTTRNSEIAFDAKAAAQVLAEIDIDTAIAAHENWKIRLQNYLAGTSAEEFKPELICMDDRCDLGKWLHGHGRERLGKYPAFTILVARHKYFHVQASTVVALAQNGNMADAEKTLNGSYRQASSQVTLMLKALKQGLGQG
jgi:hypothetical protein